MGFSPEELDRVDAKAKVTGTAQFSAEYNFPNLAYGVIVASTITKGTITSLDTKTAERAPGVLAVISHINVLSLKSFEPQADANKQPPIRRGFNVFADNVVRFNGQPIAIVVADTFERATFAASLVKAQYQKEEHHTDLHEAIKTGTPLEGNPYKENVRGEADAWKNAPVKIEAEYEMPYEVHLPIEMHGLTVNWDGPDKVTLYEKTQYLSGTQGSIARVFGIPEKNVHVITKYVGGAFGSAGSTWPHSIATVIAAKQLQRPIKLSLTRDQMFMMVGYRPKAIQKIGMGATNDGKLFGITHEANAMTASYAEFREGIVSTSRSLYACPNVTTRYKVYPLDLSLPTYMRGPGETTGMYALECAIDEMANALNMDPLQFRLLNYSETDAERKRPHSSKFLREAYQMGSEAIGWKDRNPQTASMKEARPDDPLGRGEWMVGYGMGTGVFGSGRGAAKVGVKFLADGTLILSSGVTDMGPGTSTAMTKLASETFGIPASKIKFEMGDSDLPPGPGQFGSQTTSALGSAVNSASDSWRKKMVEIAKGTSFFHTEKIHTADLKDFKFENGNIILAEEPTKKLGYGELLTSAGVKQIDLLEDSQRVNQDKYSTYAYAAHFVKLLVHPATGVIRFSKIVSVVDGGKIVSENTAKSQVIGGVVSGIGMALTEEGIIDHRYGRWVNNNFADYHVPVHADVPHIDVLFVNKPDPIVNPIGTKGIGEVTMVGFASAVANAVFHATGKRVRDLPITPDKLI
ncbi:MAG TPA: xanthine dehydrogenase family protein molybdopterin-binding subunit [Chitinophagaceae bacterium]|nr:xanthine dehydrogenase family protein molybdopterin-binding subunit [Chitinophagaceae bacterium]